MPQHARKPDILFFLLLSLLALVPLRSLLWMGDWWTQDQQSYAVRAAELAQCIRAGEWLGRWCADLDTGYGYPLFHYYAPGFYHLAAIMILAGVAVMPAIKLALALMQLLGTFGMYQLARLFYERKAAFVCALLWALLPYQQVNLFIRGALSELAALQWLVLALFLTIKNIKTPSTRSFVAAALASGSMIFTHAITALIGTPLILAFAAAFAWHERRSFAAILRAALPVFWGVALSCLYWLSALGETNFVRPGDLLQGNLSWRDHFLYIPQLFNVTYWGFGPSIPGPRDGMALHLGLAPLIFLGLAWWQKTKNRQPAEWPLLAGTIAAGVMVFFTLGISRPLWQTLPLMQFIQFPWRFLGEAGVAMCLAAGEGIGMMARTHRAFVLCILLIVLSPPWYLYPTKQVPPIVSSHPNSSELKSRAWKITAGDEYLPRDVQEKWPRAFPPQEIKIISGSGSIRQIGEQRFYISAQSPMTLIYGQYWFPNIDITANDKSIRSHPSSPNGLIQFQVNPGKCKIAITRGHTPLQRVGDWLSGVAMLLLSLFAILRNRMQFIK